MENKRMLSVAVPEDTHRRLAKLAERKSLPMAMLVRMLLREALDCCER